MDYSDRPGWRGKAPLLWPATGISLTGPGQDKTYKLGETNYPMPFHGFARHASWQVIKQSESAEMTSLTLRLADSEESRRYYPFAFELEVEYRLLKDRLSLLYRVTAGEGNSMAMPFSIGNHITFNAPLIEGSKASQLEFENTFPNQLITGSDKAFAGEIIASPFRGRRSLSELPNRKAVSLGGIEGAAELTIHDPSGLQLKMVHESSLEAAEPSIQFNLWADTNAGFFSPEPWVGTQNSLNTGFGLVTLQPGESWRWKIDILPTVHKH
jgi:galactose mutarotase-like enzyme